MTNEIIGIQSTVPVLLNFTFFVWGQGVCGVHLETFNIHANTYEIRTVTRGRATTFNAEAPSSAYLYIINIDSNVLPT
jgi:hypothetical protein